MMFYVLNVALILAGCFTFYKVLLQKETFFPLNRFVLLGCLALSFSIPLIPVPAQLSLRKANIDMPLMSNLKDITVSDQTQQPANGEVVLTDSVKHNDKLSFLKEMSVLTILNGAYWLGVIIFALNFIVQLLILLYRSYSKPVIKDGRFRIVELSGDQAPCSFGNNIFINPNKYEWETYSQIILHEKIHIQQGHSYDILFAELAIIFQWFNPFAWFYRRAIEDNLEFLTDNELLTHSTVEPSSYKMSLVKVSAPHFPISLTTNYNQSTLKKRLIMMNAKKSNLNSTWRYLFIIPILLIFISFLNEPVAYGKASTLTHLDKHQVMENEGTWFATIKNENIIIRFEFDEDGKSNNSTTFPLSAFKSLPRDKKGNFSLTREPGTIEFTGKFEGNTGMGTYKFNADDSFIRYLETEGIVANKENDALTFFMVDLKKDYVKMLKTEGYTSISKDDLIPLSALKVDAGLIRELKTAGLKNLSLQDLIPLKALGINGAYVKDIRNSGYKNVTAGNLITLKAQGINGDFIKSVKSSNVIDRVSSADQILSSTNDKGSKGSKGEKGSKDDVEWGQAFGEMIAKKALNITSEYIKSFTENGIEVSDAELISMKAMDVSPEFIKSFESIGLGKLDMDNAIAFKTLGITPEVYQRYQKIGFKNLKTSDVISAQATGTSANFIISMKKKGYDYATIDKYIQMKVLAID
ncbi:BlaR1 peptidase M56 [compost metagenome]